MSHCMICGVHFKGRGSHCALHNNYHTSTRLQDNCNSSSDSSSNRYRTAPRHRPRFAQTYDHYNQHNSPSALIHFNHGAPTNVDTALASPLVHTFTTLSHAHAISSLTYSVTPSGGQSLTAEANFEREQCPGCRRWFPDHTKLEYHQWEFPVGCEVHGLCLRMEDVQWHGTSERHERCFVRGCGSVYRKEGGWKGGVVEGHVRSWHC